MAHQIVDLSAVSADFTGAGIEDLLIGALKQAVGVGVSIGQGLGQIGQLDFFVSIAASVFCFIGIQCISGRRGYHWRESQVSYCSWRGTHGSIAHDWVITMVVDLGSIFKRSYEP